jgi:tRNA-splicing ligase RtcB
MMACKTTLKAKTFPTTWRRSASSVRCRTAARRAPRPGRLGPGAVDTAWVELDQVRRAVPRDARNDGQRAPTWARSAPATTSSRSASTRRRRLVHAALGLARLGNAIGTMFIELLSRTRCATTRTCPTATWLAGGSRHFGDYVRAVGWAQFARLNRG